MFGSAFRDCNLGVFIIRIWFWGLVLYCRCSIIYPTPPNLILIIKAPILGLLIVSVYLCAGFGDFRAATSAHHEINECFDGPGPEEPEMM